MYKFPLTYPDVDHERKAENQSNVELDTDVEACRATSRLEGVVRTWDLASVLGYFLNTHSIRVRASGIIGS